MKRTDLLVKGKIGNMYTKRFLKSKHVNMISEGDFIARLRALCKATYIIPLQSLWICFFIYVRIVLKFTLKEYQVNNPELVWLIEDQIKVINVFIIIQLYHVFLLSSVIIVMLNMTMGKGVTIFTAIFNFCYIAEALLYASFLFILDWVGILRDFSDIKNILTILKTQWLWIFAIFIAFFSYRPLKSIFRDINMWNREWTRIDRYRKTEDRENAFIFKTWVTPGEIKARTLMISAAWFCIITASVFHLLGFFATTQFTVMKYLLLIFGYIVFLSAYVVPYNKVSLYFYWINHTFLFGLLVYGLYLIQNQAFWPGYNYYYAYIIVIIPWYLSFKSAIKYTWTLKDGEEIKAVVLNMFESSDDFEEFVENNQKAQQEYATTI